ncbi:hypothetical protein ACFGVS_19060 [Mucilaginibacter sp. AW1-7]|uniref:hypothetical protein n=1 Tax=Mucilaginibacter sp. AW1-7 TaxID=3349874 RepID=UPI003F7394FC
MKVKRDTALIRNHDVIAYGAVFFILLQLVQFSAVAQGLKYTKSHKSRFYSNETLNIRPSKHMYHAGEKFSYLLESKDYRHLQFYNNKDDKFIYPRNIFIEHWAVIEDFTHQVFDKNIPHYYSFSKISSLTIKNSSLLFPVEFSRWDLIGFYGIGGLSLENDSLKSLSFDECYGDIYMKNITYQASMLNCTHSDVSLDIDGLKAKTGKILIKINESNINFKYNDYRNQDILKTSTVRFQYDSVFSVSAWLYNPIAANFVDCAIDKNPIDIHVTSNVKNSSVAIENCSLNISQIRVGNIDSLSIINSKILKPLKLNIDQYRELNISLTNTDVSNLEFDFTDNLILTFKEDSSDEEIRQTYIRLLDKFKKDGKTSSYQNVDIQYKKYELSQYGLFGKAWDFVDWAWWNYGYNRLRIIGWTCGFLLLFFFINLTIQDELLNFYPILTVNKTQRLGFLNELNAVVITIVLTMYIFFSLKVDFDKIKSDHTGMIFYFFIQYFTGLICLFFLFNAILKIE